MSKKICRTCLKWAYRTYKTHDNLHHNGEQDQVKISDVLRLLVPEMVSQLNFCGFRFHNLYYNFQYLGVTVSPEICVDCKLILKSAYAFRKKCLATENLIGSYLKKSRCNASSIELVAVLHFLEQQRKEAVALAFQDKAQEIISEWDDDDGSQDSDHSNEPLSQVSGYSL